MLDAGGEKTLVIDSHRERCHAEPMAARRSRNALVVSFLSLSLCVAFDNVGPCAAGEPPSSDRNPTVVSSYRDCFTMAPGDVQPTSSQMFLILAFKAFRFPDVIPSAFGHSSPGTMTRQ